MKKQNLVKFSLTLACAAVLTACGSSSKGNSAAAENQNANQDTQVVAPVTPVETTVAGEANASFGHQLVKKRLSNFDAGHGIETSSRSSKDALEMAIALDDSLDTIVVAGTTYNDETRVVYLEDFDFRGNTTNTSGEHTLQHILLDDKDSIPANSGLKHDPNALNQAARASGLSRTKTANQGVGSGKALVYELDRLVYIPTTAKGLPATANGRDRAGTVAEVYGNKTFLDGASTNAQPQPPTSTLFSAPNEAIDNAPFERKLNHVQYGRVTTALSDRKWDDLKDGLELSGSGKTKLGVFGKYGQDGTEDVYFYRANVDSRPVLDKDALASAYKATNIEYKGHAVTYGLDHSFGTTAGLPNAIGGTRQLMSGTHVIANLDLNTNDVTGRLYDVWNSTSNTTNNTNENTLVDFSGKLNPNNGAISGSATHKAMDATFNANLFGDNVQEMGGLIKSVATDDSLSWGASFGALATAPVASSTAGSLGFNANATK